MSFTGKVVLITGASSGIGAETAIHFARAQAKLVITARNQEKLNQVAASCAIESSDGLKPTVIVADVSKESDVEKIIETSLKIHGKLDILVNNAGVLENGSIEDTSLDQYDRVMNVNVRSVYHLTMLATPHLIKAKGNIVNISSVVGLRAFPNVLAYCMSKSALDQFTRCTALELASKGVRVNAVNPGVIKTGLHLKTGIEAEAYKQFIEVRCRETHALGRAGEAEEVAAAVLFLAGDGASFVTGVTLAIDGGRSVMCPR